jgi:acetylglutamate kinase
MAPSLTVVKIGGNILDDPDALGRFLTTFAGLKGDRLLIHGGGKRATQVADKLGIATTMLDGRRITDAAMLEVVTMVYAGLINKQVVARLQALNVNALGLTGADANLILAEKRPVRPEPGAVDYGFAGDILEVNAGQLQFFLRQNLTPVLAPITYDAGGSLLNTNADTLASAVAIDMALHNAVTLVYCFEKKGVLANPADDGSVIPRLTTEDYARHKAAGSISAGMIPKLDNAFGALRAGVSRVVIAHADDLLAALRGEAGTTLTGRLPGLVPAAQPA